MKAPVSWLREYVALPDSLTTEQLRDTFVRLGIEVEDIATGSEVTGPVVVGRVLSLVPEEQKNGKTINWCTVDVGAEHNTPAFGPDGADGRGIVCGAHNFSVGDQVVVALPGSVLPGDFAIAARKTYGHLSDGMICAADELGLPDDGSDGVIVLSEELLDGAVPGDPALPLLGADEVVFDLEVTPDMAHCLSIRGLARELGQALQVSFTDPVGPDPVAADLAPVEGAIPVSIEDPRCRRFVALSVTGIDPTRPTPAFMSRRLAQSDIRSLSLPIDITNYVMLELGNPLHGYDAGKLTGGLGVRAARDGEQLTTLDDAVRTLAAGDLVIVDESGPIGLAGVMGGASTEMSEATTDVVIEAAAFDPASVSRTARTVKLTSESSKRFERGVDHGACVAAARRAAELLVRYAGGTISPDVTVAGEPEPMPSTTFGVDLPQRILGMPVTADQVVTALEGAGCTVARTGGEITVTPPTWRTDLVQPYDYVEEVGQKVGLENIVGILPRASGGRGYTARQRARRAVVHALADQGFVELLTLPWQSDHDLDVLGVSAADPRRNTVRVANPLAETSPDLRSTLLPGLLRAALRNASRGIDDLAIFEVGSVFRASETPVPAPRPSLAQRPSTAELEQLAASVPPQPTHLGVLLTGAWVPARPGQPAQPATWQHAVAAVEAVARTLGLTLTRQNVSHAPFHPGRCAEFRLGEVVVGHAGELHPSMLADLKAPERACAAEINLDLLLAHADAIGTIAALSPHPVVKEDVALVVDAGTSAAAVERALVAGAGELLEEIRLFDVYAGEQLGEGKVSLAYALRFRASDRTLKDAEVAKAREAAVAEAARVTGATLRT